MQYTIKYDRTILWKGKTQFFEYTLHRALVIADEGWMVPGYALFSENQAESNVAEVYGENNVEPGNGLYGDMIAGTEETDKPLPPADRRDVVDFATLFAELCESHGELLLDSEILM